MNDEKDPQGNPWIKSAMIWAGVIVALLLFVSLFDSRTATTAGTGIAYSEFRSKVQEGQVKDVAIAPDRITGTLSSGQKFSTVPVNDPGLPKMLDDFNVKYSGQAEEQPSFWASRSLSCVRCRKAVVLAGRWALANPRPSC